MKIKEIKEDGRVYTVTLEPNWLEKLFGVKEKDVVFKDTYRTFTYGDGHVYLRKDGTMTGNGDWIPSEIDKWRRKF